jgi:FkbM family methyltransferase
MPFPLKNTLMRHHPHVLGRLLRLKPNWNRDLFTFLHVVRKGDVVLDVGANEGTYTEAFAHLAGRSGEVHAFEPVPTTMARLRLRFSPPASWPQITLHEAAATDRPGPVALLLPGTDSGQASLRSHQDGSWTGAAPVQKFPAHGVTLDGAMMSRAPQRVDLIKIDVEGAELLVLRGARELLRVYRPMVFFEVWERWTRDFGYDAAALAAELEAAGYNEFTVVADRIQRLPNLREAWAAALAAGSHNVLAGISARHDERLRAFHGSL